MAKISKAQLETLMMLARAETADEWVKATDIRFATFKALLDRSLIDHSAATGRVWVDRSETSAALWALHGEADDKRYRHESRCRAFQSGADCGTCDKLFQATGDAFDTAEAFDNVFKPFTVEFLTAGGEWRTLMSEGVNVRHFARIADAEEYIATRPALSRHARIMRNGLWIDETTADAVCDAYEEHAAEIAAQDALIAQGSEIDANVERYGTANPVTFDAPESGATDCACCGVPIMASDIRAANYCDECGDNCPGSGSGVVFKSAWHCPSGRCDGTGCVGDEHVNDGLDDLRALLTF